MSVKMLEAKTKLLPKEADALLVLPLYAALNSAQQLKVTYYPALS
jgi:HrpA-like RNA helicase